MRVLLLTAIHALSAPDTRAVPKHVAPPCAGGLKTLVALRSLVVDCGGAAHVLQTVLMAYPNQASSLQGSRSVSSDILAANDLGTGSGWQQSKQNWALLAVVGK